MTRFIAREAVEIKPDQVILLQERDSLTDGQRAQLAAQAAQGLSRALGGANVTIDSRPSDTVIVAAKYLTTAVVNGKKVARLLSTGAAVIKPNQIVIFRESAVKTGTP